MFEFNIRISESVYRERERERERRGEASRYHCSFLFDLRVAPSKIACQYKACLYLTFYDMVLNAKAKLCLTEANQKRSCMLRNP